MSRFFYAVPYTMADDAPHWGFNLYGAGVAHEEVMTALDLWNQQVLRYPVPLTKSQAKTVDLFKRTVCQTIQDLWRWHLGSAVGRHHVWSGQEAIPQVQELPRHGKGLMEPVRCRDTILVLPAHRLLLLDGSHDPVDRVPLGHLQGGICQVVDYFVGEDLLRVNRMLIDERRDDSPGAQYCSTPVDKTPGLVKHVVVPLFVAITKRPEHADTDLMFIQHQGFMRAGTFFV